MFDSRLRLRATTWLAALLTLTLWLLASSDRAAGSDTFLSRIAWTTSSPAPGLKLLAGGFHVSAPALHWTVTIEAPTTSPFDGSREFAEAGSAAWATDAEQRLRSDGYSPTAQVLPWPRYADDPRGAMGVRVRVGEFATKADASAAAASLSAAGFTPLVEWEGFDPDRTPDAEQLHVAIVDPAVFQGRTMAIHGTAVASRETVAAQAQRVGALAAVNAGFFTIAAGLPAVAGVPTGLGIYDGRLEALANDSRADIVFGGRGGAAAARIDNLTTEATLRAGGASVRVLGINRQPGSAEDCGVPGFSPTSQPRQGVICTGADDLVLFTPEFGAALPTGPGAQATLDGAGRVVAVGARGGSVPAGGSVVQALGARAYWLTAHATLGSRVRVIERLRDASGRDVQLGPHASAASAAPVLLRGGRVWIDAVREGVFDPRDLFDYGFSAERHARTMAGIDRRGRLLLVTADGVPGVSEGLTLSEEAQLMRRLGARDAMNLDGGGSTTFVVGDATVNTTSDVTGPRPVGDSIVIVP
jgi:Phosphodiester glycosidase/SPOR domain